MSNGIYPKERELDGIFYRVKRNGKSHSICFSDLTEQEQDKILAEYDEEALRRMCKILVSTLRNIGDQFGIMGRIDTCDDGGE